ncbi:MAG TPA: uroporphyrinogen-III synthase [Myxococcales bacterium]|nr:uroporphyrinogen-III synthase [Myxococcales bacterium]
MRLNGERIALFEARMGGELSDLVRRNGGVPVCVPAVSERRSAASAHIGRLLDELAREEQPAFVFSTGIGVAAMFEEARTAGREPELRGALSRGLTVCRGPKPVAALHKEGIAAALKAESPYTTRDLLFALARTDLADRFTVLVHYGEPNEPLAQSLLARGARLRDLMLYRWELPDDTRALAKMIDALSDGSFAAAAFTSQIQARNLMTVASRSGRKAALLRALGGRVVVAAVGPTCAKALEELGMPAQVVPDPPKMGAMVAALAAHLGALR